MFAEGIEAIFRFSLALLKKSEDKLVEMEFEQILSFLQSDLFEMYRVVPDVPKVPVSFTEAAGQSEIEGGNEEGGGGQGNGSEAADSGEHSSSALQVGGQAEEEWRANDFVRDAYEIRM